MPIRMSGMMSGLDTEAIVKEMMTAQSMKKTKIENQKTKLEWKQEKWKDLNTKVYDLYTGSLTKMKLQSTFGTRTTTSSDTEAVTAIASASSPIGTSTIEVKELASSQYLTGEEVKYANGSSNLIKGSTTKLEDIFGDDLEDRYIQIQVGNKEAFDIKLEKDMTVNEFVNKLKEAGINANFDDKQQRFFIGSKDSGIDNAFTMIERKAEIDEDLSEKDASGKYTKVVYKKNSDGKLDLKEISDRKLLSSLGLGEITKEADGTFSYERKDTDGNNSKSFIVASNAKVIVNGVEFEDATNQVEINGVTYKVNSKTPDGKPIKVEVTKDTSKVYETVKKFVDDYNEVLKELNKVYSAESAKDYDVLTDEQKEAMTDEQVEKWENKIKDSLLRNDSTVNSLASALRTSIFSTVTVNGKVYSLSSIGISTSSDYTEKGILHIHGDSDDKIYSSEVNKLQDLINNDPDTVMQVINNMAKNLYDTLSDKMKSTSLSSALTFYNDKQMKSQLDTYKKQIKDWDTKLTKLEDRYYKQFTAMEKAMSKMNTQSNNLASMLPNNNN